MQRASILRTALLGSLSVLILQLQFTNGLSQMCDEDLVHLQAQAPLSATSLIRHVKVFIRNGQRTNLQGKSACDHFQTLLTPLGNVGKLTLSTSGPPQHDQTLFSNNDFWSLESALHPDDTKKSYDGYMQGGPILYIATKPGQTLSLTETLFPHSSSRLPQNRLLNMTFDCTTKKLDMHTEIISEVEVIPQILGFSNLVLSLQVTLGVQPHFHTVILSGNTKLFSMATFVAVKYKFDSKEISIRGVPVDTTSLNMQNVLKAISGASLKVPLSMSTISQVTFLGQVENGTTTIAIKGKSGESEVAMLLQKSSSKSNTALIADIQIFNLASFVKTALNIDITRIPLFGTLSMTRIGFSAATGNITSPILPRLYKSGSSLETFGTTLPKGVSAYFTVRISGVNVNVSFSLHKFTFKIPKTASLSLKQLLSQIPKLGNLDSLPKVVTDILNSKLSGFMYDPERKLLKFGLIIPQLTIIPNMLKLMNVNFTLLVTFGQRPSVKTFQFSGTWKFSTVMLTTSINYNREKKVFLVKAVPGSGSTSLSIEALIKKVAGVGVKLPSIVSSLSLTSVVGKVYGSGKYFLALSGTFSGGELYLLFFKEAEGVKVGIAASVKSFKLSALVKSALKIDITNIPLLGSLTMSRLSFSAATGNVTSPILPQLYKSGSSLLEAFGTTLPKGVSAYFTVRISEVNVNASFSLHKFTFKIPKTASLSLKQLLSQIPKLGNLDSLPKVVTDILNSKLSGFMYDPERKLLKFGLIIPQLTIIPNMLKLINVNFSLVVTFGQRPSVKTFKFFGTWKFSTVRLTTSIDYNREKKVFLVKAVPGSGSTSLSIEALMKKVAGVGVKLPSIVSSLSLTSVVGKVHDSGKYFLALSGTFSGGEMYLLFFKEAEGVKVGIAASVKSFKLSALVKSALKIDITNIPLFGSLAMSRLSFSAATGNITSPILPRLYKSGSSLLEAFGTTLPKGVSAYFTVRISEVNVNVSFSLHKFTFKIPMTAFLSLKQLLSQIPKLGNLDSLPKVVTDILNSKLSGFMYDPERKLLKFGLIIPQLTIIPNMLKLMNVNFTLVVTFGEKPSVKTFQFSGTWKFSTVRLTTSINYNREKKVFLVKAVPGSDSTSLSIEALMKKVAGVGVKLPSIVSSLSLTSVVGKVHDSGKYFLALSGTFSGGEMYLLFFKEAEGVKVGIAASVKSFKLSALVKSALKIDITNIPLFGSLAMSQLSFSAATGNITSPILPRLYKSGSSLEVFGTTLPKGVSAYFTVHISGVNMKVSFSLHKFTFKIPKTAFLSLKQLLSQIPKLGNLDSLPKVVTDILNSKLSGFMYDPERKLLKFGLIIPQLTIIPNMLKLMNVNFTLVVTFGQRPSVKTFQFSGTWKFSTVRLTTSIDYSREKKVFLVKAVPRNDSTPLNIGTLVKKVAGISGKLPNVLTSLSLSNVVGNIYINEKYFLAISGTISGGKLYMLFYKDREGVKVGIAASVKSFQISTLVKSTVGVDITDIPYFGSLIVPTLAISITSGVIKSPVLFHLFGEGSPLLVYGDTLPAGVTARFHLDESSVSPGVTARFVNGVLEFQVPKMLNFSVLALASKIPGISSAMWTLPSQIRNILSAKVTSFFFNSTSKGLSIRASLSRLTLVSGFLSITNILIFYDGRLGKTLITRMLDIRGTWEIGKYDIFTRVIYNGSTKELTIANQPSGGKNLSISNVVESLAGTTVPLPSVLSSFTFTGITGKLANGTIVVVLNGRVSGGKISVVFQKNSSRSAGAVVVNITNFKLAELVKSATGAKIGAIPLFGTLEIPELNFVAATNNITSPILRELAGSDPALEWLKSGIVKGVTGHFVIQIGNVSRVTVNFAHNRLDFKVPNTSSLSFHAVLSEMSKIKHIISSLPSQLSSVLNAEIAAFSYDPTSNELQFIGSLKSTVKIIPHFLSLRSVNISLVLVLGQSMSIKTLEFSGNWMLKNLLIRTGVSYNRKEEKLYITGELNGTNGGINIQELITALSGHSLSLPSALSSVKLSKLSGNKIGDVTFVSLSGSVANGRIFLIYQKSPSGSAVAFAADIPKFRFSSLVSSTTGIDISNIPIFGTLIIPQIGFTIASKHITNPSLSTIFPPNSFLAKFGGSISKGVTASFSVDLADVKGIVADFAHGELSLHIPKTVDLSLINIVSQTGLQNVIDSLPRTIREIGSTKLRKLHFILSTKELQLSGSLKSLEIIPNFLKLQNIEFDFAGTIGKNSQVKFVKFKGDWILNTLNFTTEVFYDKKLLLVKGSPSEDKVLSVTNLIKGLKVVNLNIPSALNSIKVTQVIGKIQNRIFSIVLVGEIGTIANFALVYEQSKFSKVVAFAADVQKFHLTELIKAGTGINISSVPLFGNLTIMDLSFIASSKHFTTANLPNLKVTGVHVPKELLFDSIPAGVKGHFLVNIGSASRVMADISRNVLTIKVPSSTSLSLQNLLSVVPEIQSTIHLLPARVKEILSARITKLAFDPGSKYLFISLSLDSLTLVPNSMVIKDLNISLITSFSSNNQLLVQKMQTAGLWRHGDLDAEDQAMSVNTLEISALWVIRGIKVQISIKYNKQQKLFNIRGNPSSNNGIRIADIIKGFSSASLPIPSILSSLNLTKVVAVSSEKVTTIILTATAGTANVYLAFQKTQSFSAMAIAAEIHAFKVVDLIKTATGIDLTGVPFISSFVASSMAFSASTNPISTSLLATTFKPDSPLHTYGTTLPKGVTAHFEAQIAGKIGVAVSYQNKKLIFVIPSKVTLSLSNLLSEIRSLNSLIKALPSPMSDLLSSRLKAIEFDAATKTLSVAASLRKLTIIPKVMQINNLEVKFVAILSSINGGLQSLDFSADWVLRNVHIRIKVLYDKRSRKVVFSATPKQALNIQKLIRILTGINIPLPSAIKSVKLDKIVGRKESHLSTVIFSGTIPNKAGVYLIYQSRGRTSNIAIAAGINSFKLAKLVQSAVNIDISSVPFFGTFSVPSIALTISKGQIKTDLLGKVLASNSPLIKYGNTIPDGFTAKFDASLPIPKRKYSLGDVLTANSQYTQIIPGSTAPNANSILGSFSGKILSFTVPPSIDASLSSLISVIPGFDIKSIAGIEHLFGDLLRIKIKQFSFDVSKREMNIELFLQKIVFYEKLLTIRNIQLNLTAILSTSIALSAEASGTISLGKTNYVVNIRRVKGKYALTVETKKLPIFSLITAIGARFLPENLERILRKALNIDIVNAKVVYPFGVKPQQIQLSGTLELFGLKTVQMTAIAFKYRGKIILIQKFNLGMFNIADLIKHLVGVSLHKLKILNQIMHIDFIMSPSTVEGVSFSASEFKPTQGISIKASLDWPSDCSSDKFCNVAKTLLGGLKLSLEGTIASTQYFALTVTIGDLKLGGGVVLLQAGLQFVGGTNPSVGIVGSIKLKKPAITLTAAIRLTVEGMKLEGSMSGCWYNAFGSSYLTICNLFLSMTIIPTPLPISGLEFGGKIEAGKRSCGHALTAEVYIGINLINPNEDYFYADLGPVTFQKFLDAFCIHLHLPKPLAESGFPNGFKASYSLLGKQLPQVGITIPAGLHVKGTLNIFGLAAYANIQLTLPRIVAKIKLPPLTIGGVFKMYKSSTDTKAGPYLNANITTNKLPQIEASGYVKVFGISVETKLVLTNSTFQFEFTGKFLKLFLVQLRIYANYTKSITKAGFLVEGRFKNDLFDKIATIVRNALTKSANEADKHIKNAQNKIKEEKTKFDRANAKLQDAKRKVDHAKRAFDHAIGKIERARRKVNHVCHYKSCKSVCIGCPKGWKCCARVWKKCVCERPGWKRCCKRIHNPICVAKNTACALLKKPLILILHVAKKVVEKSKLLLNIAKGALSVAQGVVNFAKRSLDIAIKALDVVRAIYKVGVSALNAITKFVLTKIIDIKEMYFKVQLSVASGGIFQCRVKGVLMGKHININVNFNTHKLLTIAKSLGEKALKGISKFIG